MITVLRTFGGVLLLNSAPLQYINVTWVTRDLSATWKTRDERAAWKSRDEVATWKARGIT